VKDAMTLLDLSRQRRPQPKQRDLEGPIHRAVMSYLRLTLRGAVIHHSPNEVGVKGKDIARAIAKAKHNGMVVGFPDIIIIWRGRIWTFEVKAPGRKPTEEQEQVGVRIIAQGGRWAVVRSVDDAAALVREWSQDAREDVA